MWGVGLLGWAPRLPTEELRLGAAEHVGEPTAGGMAAGDCDKGVASVTRCCLSLSRGEAKNGNGVGLSS